MAVVDAFVGEVERREKPDDFAEPLLGQLVRALGQRLELAGGGGGEQGSEVGQAQVALGQGG